MEKYGGISEHERSQTQRTASCVTAFHGIMGKTKSQGGKQGMRELLGVMETFDILFMVVIYTTVYTCQNSSNWPWLVWLSGLRGL